VKIVGILLVLGFVGIIFSIPEGHAGSETPFDFKYKYKET